MPSEIPLLDHEQAVDAERARWRGLISRILSRQGYAP